MISIQEYYNRLVKAAKNGTFPSAMDLGNGVFSCKYRANKQADCRQRCAVGILIPDSLYYEGLEGHDANSYIILQVIEAVEGLNSTDLKEVQRIHDGVADHGTWNVAVFISRINKLLCFAGVQKQEA